MGHSEQPRGLASKFMESKNFADKSCCDTLMVKIYHLLVGLICCVAEVEFQVQRGKTILKTTGKRFTTLKATEARSLIP